MAISSLFWLLQLVFSLRSAALLTFFWLLVSLAHLTLLGRWYSVIQERGGEGPLLCSVKYLHWKAKPFSYRRGNPISKLVIVYEGTNILWMLCLVLLPWSDPMYYVNVQHRQYSVSIWEGERKGRSTILFSQRAYTERLIPPLVEEETLLPGSSKGGTHRQTGRSHNPTTGN